MVKLTSIKNFQLKIKNYAEGVIARRSRRISFFQSETLRLWLRVTLCIIFHFSFLIFNCLYCYQKSSYFVPSVNKTVDIAGGEIIVKSSDIDGVNLKFGTKVKQKLYGKNVYLLKIPAGETVESILQKILGFPGVQYAEPNYLAKMFSNDTYYNNQWSLPNTVWDNAYNSSATLTSSFYTGSSTFVVIAVIDSGVDWQHPDLANVFWYNVKESTYSDGIDNDGNGYIDDYYGYNTLYGQEPPTSPTDTEEAEYADRRPWDTVGHGTHVSGIAAAQIDNDEGIAGVSWVSQIMAIKVFSQYGGGEFFNIAAGLIYAADNGAKIINMSLGSSVGSQSLKEAIDYAVSKGCVVVVASGNESENEISYPAAYDNCIAVGASDRYNARVSFSNYGPQLDVVAPGGGASTSDKIYSTYSVSTGAVNSDGSITWAYTVVVAIEDGMVKYFRCPTYRYMQGTSMSAPFVSGLAALVISQNPTFTPKQVEERIESTCDDINTPGRDFYSGWGRVNVYRALTNNKNVYYVSSGGEKVKSYPNPFYPNVHGKVTIRLPQSYQSAEKFRITIYNIAGRPVKISDSSSLETSMGDEGLVYWDGRNDNGDMVASGLYYYVVDTGGKKFRGKITLIK